MLFDNLGVLNCIDNAAKSSVVSFPLGHAGLGKSLRSCSIGINRFWLDGLVGFFCVLLGKNRFWLVWLINLFNWPQTGLKFA